MKCIEWWGGGQGAFPIFLTTCFIIINILTIADPLCFSSVEYRSLLMRWNPCNMNRPKFQSLVWLRLEFCSFGVKCVVHLQVRPWASTTQSSFNDFSASVPFSPLSILSYCLSCSLSLKAPASPNVSCNSHDKAEKCRHAFRRKRIPGMHSSPLRTAEPTSGWIFWS